MVNLAPQSMDEWMRNMERRMSRVESAGQPRTLTPNRILLPGTPDADTTVGNLPPLQIGDSTGANLRMDNNEVLAANNGSQASLYLNSDGGNVYVGNDATVSPTLQVGNTDPLNVTPALRLSRGRSASVLVESMFYQQANDLPILGLQLLLNGTVDTTYAFQPVGGAGTGRVTTLNGGTARPITPFSFQLGTYNQSAAIAAGAGINQSTSLATGRFTQPPAIFMGTDTQRLTIDSESITTSGFTLRAYNFTPTASSANVNIWWLAVQMTANGTTG